MATAETGQRVIPCAAIVLGDLPLGSNQVLTFEAVERGIQRALPQLEHVLGPLFDAFGNAPSMHRLELQRLEHQHVEGPLQDVAFFARHVFPFDRRKKRSGCSFRLSRGTAIVRFRGSVQKSTCYWTDPNASATCSTNASTLSRC